jgi:hypothetical protein
MPMAEEDSPDYRSKHGKGIIDENLEMTAYYEK